jgi:tetratricopeptide (TPR) repeat protein
MRWQLLIPNMVIFDSMARRVMPWRWAAAFLLLAGAGTALADRPPNPVFVARAAAEFDRTRAQHQSNTNDSTAALKFARACFNFADLATNETQRATLANQGITACHQWLAREPDSAPAHYYLAMNFGQLAQAEAPSLAAYRLVREIEREFRKAAELDGHFDYGGPDRGLGLLYRDAPGWPLSIGSRHKAREWLEQAEKLAPDYPENHLNLAEAFLRWHDRTEANRELQALDAVWPVARTNLVGPAWEPSWADWSARREVVRKGLGETARAAGSSKR